MKNINKTNQWIKKWILTLKSILDLSNPEFFRLNRAVDQYYNFMLSRSKSRGHKETVAFLKRVATLSVKLTLGIPYEALPFTKADKSGFPLKLSLVKTYLSGDIKEKRIGLCIINIYKSILLPVDYSTETITSPSTATGDLSIKWLKFLKNNFSKKFESRKLDWAYNWRSSNKMGPNGPSLLTSMLDLWSVRKDERVWTNLVNYLTITKDDLLNEIHYLFENNPDPQLPVLPTGRLAFLPEGGGKTRVIAIGDYFSQQALTPLFKETMRMLKSLPQDGTYNQSHGVKLITDAMNDRKPIYCFDLKSATDRFPRKLQEEVLDAIFGPGIGLAWSKLISERSFSFLGKDIEYAVGQPMGLLSSWSTFALTHHAFIQYCASREGITTFSDYTVLGDDVAIFNKKVALRYQRLISKLGVVINLEKSLIWVPEDKTWPYAEFAKRIICKGHDISPIPLDILETYMRAPVKEYYSLRWTLMSFGIDISGQPSYNLSSYLGPKDRLKMSILANAPSTLLGKMRRNSPTALYEGEMEGPWKGLDENLIPAALVDTLFREYYTKTLEVEETVSKLDHYDTVVEQVSQLQGRSLVKRPTLQLLAKVPINDGQPLLKIIHQKRADLAVLMLRCRKTNAIKGWDVHQVERLWETVLHCTDDFFSSLLTKKQKYSEVQSSIVLKIHSLLKKGFVPALKELEDLPEEEEVSYNIDDLSSIFSRIFELPK